jgi:hypothetical protein
MLGLAASLSSPTHRHRTEVKLPSADNVQRINQLWLVTMIDETGEEVVVQAKLTNGSYAPLIAADPVRLNTMLPAAHDIAKTRNINLRLIKLTDRSDVEVITP